MQTTHNPQSFYSILLTFEASVSWSFYGGNLTIINSYIIAIWSTAVLWETNAIISFLSAKLTEGTQP